MNTVVDDCTGITFALGSVRGIRTFDVDAYGWLTAVTRKDVWKPGENTARCPYYVAKPHSTEYEAFVRNAYLTLGAPYFSGPCKGIAHPKCACGFYAYHDGTIYPGGQVTGVIEGWGKTTVGTKGFRCEKAKILALTVPGVLKTSRTEWINGILWAAQIIGFGQWLSAAFSNPGSWVNWVVAALFFPFSTSSAWFFVSARRKRVKHNTAVVPMRGVVERNYPDVLLFDTVKEMRAVFPPDRGAEPSPETDPMFWERSS